jgi:hypothetical protein
MFPNFWAVLSATLRSCLQSAENQVSGSGHLIQIGKGTRRYIEGIDTLREVGCMAYDSGDGVLKPDLRWLRKIGGILTARPLPHRIHE